VGWNPEASPSPRIDVDLLRQRLAACKRHGHAEQELCPECAALLDEAVDLYGDGFLAGYSLPDSPAFDEWQFFEGETLRDEFAGALQRLAGWYGARGEYDRAIPYARRWLALDPLHEPAHRALMRLYVQAGQRTAALRQYDECTRLLADELGIVPGPETEQLYRAIRERRELPGDHRPHPGVSANPRGVHNLPAQLTPFVSREALLADIAQRLADPACRLLTLVGPGGSGKTRLALEAVRWRLDDYGTTSRST